MRKDYFREDQMLKQFSNQVVFIESDNNEMEFHKFKVVEIEDGNSVKVLFTFLHPKYKGQQNIYFS